MKRKLNVLFAAFEAAPFMKTGGLGDVAGSLPQALKKAGCEIRVMIPKFKTMPEKYKEQLTHVTNFFVPLGWRNLYVGIETLVHRGVTYYFVDNEYYFGRDRAYGYFDDGERIAYFSKAICESLKYLPDFKCDILHCNDWHTALSTVFLREFYHNDDPLYEQVKTVFTVHNLKFQGQMSDMVLGDILGLYGIKNAEDQLRVDDHSINFMKGALCYSDILTTVSETYAQEIQRPFFGENMDDIFRRRSSVLYGIMNGIDTEVYNCETDKLIEKPYSRLNLTGKEVCKEAIQREMGLEIDPDIPVMAMVGRLTAQKGMDLVDRVIDDILKKPIQFIVLGTGDQKYEDMLRYYEWKYPEKMRSCIMFDEALSHRLYAGSDMFLMPSVFEPCGLSQMIAMGYGSLPIVRETGGLKDSVIPYNEYTGAGTGFSFANINAHEMLHAIEYALDVYNNEPVRWRRLMENAMSEDFSWNRAASKYLEIYEKLCPADKQ